MKLPKFPLYVPMSEEMEELYTKTNRKRFVPLLRFCLCLLFIIDGGTFYWDYIHDETLYYFDLNVYLLSFYFILFVATFIPGSVRFIHAIGVAAISGVIFAIAFMVSNFDSGYDNYLALFLIPLQIAPVMTSFVAALATMWMAVVIIFDFAEKTGVSAASMDNVQKLLCYYLLISVVIAYVATQYRRAAFKLEKNLEQARSDAESANEAKSTFLATMSHEVRTPLNGILGLVTLMKDTPLNDQQKDYIETMKYSGETLLTILNDILDISKMEAGKFDLEIVDFDIERLVSSVVTLMKSRAEEKGLSFDYKIEPNVPMHVRSDPTRIRQVLLNLTGNAIKFTQSGFVHVHVSSTAKDGEGLKLSFEVSDTGIGISEESQKNLFQEFAQADSSISRKYGGTGLGLAICKKIVELMNGRIGAVSTTGQGSTFWFEIAVEPGEAANAAGTDQYLGSDVIPVFKPLKILVAEDNKINQKVIAGLLERCGLGVTFANNGMEAVDLLQDSKKSFDLVLMDMQMPVMDGLTAAGVIRELPGGVKKIPIVALTANAVKGDEQRCLAAGMNGYVPKPIDPRQLYKAISTHVPDSIIPGETRAVKTPEARRGSHAGFEHLDRIESMMGRDFVKKFAEDGLMEVRDLINAICNGSNSKDIKRAAHNLKSLSSMFGLRDVQALAESIELSESDDSNGERAMLNKMLQEKYESDLSLLTEKYLQAV